MTPAAYICAHCGGRMVTDWITGRPRCVPACEAAKARRTAPPVRLVRCVHPGCEALAPEETGRCRAHESSTAQAAADSLPLFPGA